MPDPTIAVAWKDRGTPSVFSSANINPLKLISSAWTGASEGGARTAEETLLRRYVPSPYRLGRVAIELPQLGLGVQHINTLDVNGDAKSDQLPIVLTHGAGAGIGMFFKNIESLANLGGVSRRLVAFDWLGAAGSSRPSFPYGPFACLKPSWMLSEQEAIDAAIRFHVESLEAWRAAMGLERFDLIAHSMGGFLATQYALTHPDRVRRLVLISPVGWARRPESDRPELAKARWSGVMGALWEAGIGNFGLARLVGRVLRGAAKSAVVGRLNLTDPEEVDLVGDYFWNSLCGKPISAEKNVNWLLVPYSSPAPFGFYGRRPVSTEPAERLARLPPTTLIYGSHDLHYIPTMPQAIKSVQAASRAPVRMVFVRYADHHLYVDNPQDFHREVEVALAPDAGA